MSVSTKVGQVNLQAIKVNWAYRYAGILDKQPTAPTQFSAPPQNILGASFCGQHQ